MSAMTCSPSIKPRCVQLSMQGARSRSNPTRGRVFHPIQAISPPGLSKSSYNNDARGAIHNLYFSDGFYQPDLDGPNGIRTHVWSPSRLRHVPQGCCVLLGSDSIGATKTRT